MEFKERLLEILIKRNLSNSDLSRETGLSTARISNFCNGIDMPSLDNALLLVNYFHFTFQYLFGLSYECKTISFRREYSSSLFLKKLKVLLSANLMSYKQLCLNAEINKSCISNWRNGQKPKSRNLIKIAKILNCTIDCLLGLEE